MSATVRDRVLLLLSIKEPGKKIGFDHILEKVFRDEAGTLTKESLEEGLETLEKESRIRVEDSSYRITDEGIKELEDRLPKVGDSLNLSYRRVLEAKGYYGMVAEYLLPFLRGRPVSLVKIFSDDTDPITKVKPLFVRYQRYKPKPIFIRIDTPEDLKRYLDDHALDYVPYVHSFDMKEPSWLVIDLDAGEGLKTLEEGFTAVKFVARELISMLNDSQVRSALKFSGSRGMQIWASLDNSLLPKEDIFALYRSIIQKLQSALEERISDAKVPSEIRSLADGGMTTSTVARKGERSMKVLLDWSSMKPYGDVRAPFSMHYKTGLISCPVDPMRIKEFELNSAKPELVAKSAEVLSGYFSLEKSNPSSLLHTLGL
jgi:DNA primase